MKPLYWRVSWQALGTDPAGFADYNRRHEARGFYLIRKASGFEVTITPMWQ